MRSTTEMQDKSPQDAPDVILMTRFNLATPGREQPIRLSRGWLERRFDLFERYCLPSVAAQTDRSFRWLIWFDEATPAPWRARIATLCDIQPFEPIFTGLFGAEGWRAGLGDLDPASRLLTVRLDNDDALACDFVERLRQAALPRQAPRFFNFTHGLVRCGGALYALDHGSNAFIARLERAGTAETVMTVPHMAAATRAPVEQIGGAPAWMQLVHGRNVSNRIRGRRICPSEALSGRWSGQALAGLSDPPRWRLAAENAVLRPLRGLRDGLAALGRSHRVK